MEKVCSACKVRKAISLFTQDKHSKDGFTYNCKLCRNAKAKQHPSNSKEKRAARNIKFKEARKLYYTENKDKFKNDFLKRSFGISLADYQTMLEKQNGVCAICYHPQISSRNKAFAVDHNHETGKVRGLLCDRCNRGLGLFKDSKKFLQSAIEYLNKE